MPFTQRLTLHVHGAASGVCFSRHFEPTLEPEEARLHRAP